MASLSTPIQVLLVVLVVLSQKGAALVDPVARTIEMCPQVPKLILSLVQVAKPVPVVSPTGQVMVSMLPHVTIVVVKDM